MIHEEIGTAAGAVWRTLETHGELSLSNLKKETGLSSPIFDWAIGWLAREHKVILTKDKRSWLIRLEGHAPNGVSGRPAASSARANTASA